MYKIYIPTEFYLGCGAFKQLYKIPMPGKKALVVTTSGNSVKKYGYLDLTLKQLEEQGIESVVFAGILPNPTRDSILEGAAVANENGCDFVIGLGGGSPMDAAKAIALKATNPGDLWDYVTKGSGKGLPLENDPLPVVCISTTAGTGSEADCSGMVTYPERGEKVGVSHPLLFPRIAIVDPELTVSVPPFQTAIQGLDTFFHCAEGYLSRATNPFKDMYALEAIRQVGQSLGKCVDDGKDLQAREAMSFANTLGGFVMSTGGLISEHALEHILSAYYPELPHGVGLILISRAYFKRLIALGACPKRFIKLAQVLGMENASVPGDFLVAYEELLEKCKVSDLKMSAYGIEKCILPKLAREVWEKMKGNFMNDPVRLSAEDCAEIFLSSWG